MLIGLCHNLIYKQGPLLSDQLTRRYAADFAGEKIAELVDAPKFSFQIIIFFNLISFEEVKMIRSLQEATNILITTL